MPIIHQIIESEVRIAVWKITESEEELLALHSLSAKQVSDFEKVINPRRRAEWLVVRRLLQILSEKNEVHLHYDENGKPNFLDTVHPISISHSREYVAVIWSDKKEVGIDIEKMEARIHKIAHKFVNDAEKEFLGENPSTENLYLIWGIKESLFKIYSRGELDFRLQLFVHEIESGKKGKARASVHKEDYQKEFILQFERKDDWSLVYGIED